MTGSLRLGHSRRGVPKTSMYVAGDKGPKLTVDSCGAVQRCTTQSQKGPYVGARANRKIRNNRLYA
jgi:hypothetical protein